MSEQNMQDMMKGPFGDAMMKQAEKMQEKMKKMQEELERTTFTASDIEGNVTVTVNGKGDVLKIVFGSEADVDGLVVLGQTTVSTIAAAKQKSEKHMQEKMMAFSKEFGMPGTAGGATGA